MKTLTHLAFIAMTATLTVVAPMPTHAADPRHGVIVSLQPIENRGEDESAEVGERRKYGKLAGLGASLGVMLAKTKSSTGFGTGGAVAAQAAPAVGEKVAEKIGGPGPTTRYMVKVKLDSRKVLSFTQLRTELGDLKEGDRVIVTGTGDESKAARE